MDSNSSKTFVSSLSGEPIAAEHKQSRQSPEACTSASRDRGFAQRSDAGTSLAVATESPPNNDSAEASPSDSEATSSMTHKSSMHSAGFSPMSHGESLTQKSGSTSLTTFYSTSNGFENDSVDSKGLPESRAAHSEAPDADRPGSSLRFADAGYRPHTADAGRHISQVPSSDLPPNPYSNLPPAQSGIYEGISAPFRSADEAAFLADQIAAAAETTPYPAEATQTWGPPGSFVEHQALPPSTNIMAQYTGAQSWGGNGVDFGEGASRGMPTSSLPGTALPPAFGQVPIEFSSPYAPMPQQPKVSDRFLKLVDTVCNDLHRLGVQDVTVSMFEQHFARMRNGKKVAYRKLGFSSMEHLFMTQQPHFVVRKLPDGTLGVRTQAYASYLQQLDSARQRGETVQLPDFGANVPPMRPSAPVHTPSPHFGQSPYALNAAPPAGAHPQFPHAHLSHHEPAPVGSGYSGYTATDAWNMAGGYQPQYAPPPTSGGFQQQLQHVQHLQGQIAAQQAANHMHFAQQQMFQPQQPASSLGGRSASSDSAVYAVPPASAGFGGYDVSASSSPPLWGLTAQQQQQQQQYQASSATASTHDSESPSPSGHNSDFHTSPAHGSVGGAGGFAGYNAWPKPRAGQ